MLLFRFRCQSSWPRPEDSFPVFGWEDEGYADSESVIIWGKFIWKFSLWLFCIYFFLLEMAFSFVSFDTVDCLVLSF